MRCGTPHSTEQFPGHRQILRCARETRGRDLVRIARTAHTLSVRLFDLRPLSLRSSQRTRRVRGVSPNEESSDTTPRLTDGPTVFRHNAGLHPRLHLLR